MEATWRQLLKLLMTLLVVRGTLALPGGSPAVCGSSCCQVLPTCQTAWRVNCVCVGKDTMRLRRGNIPSTVRSVTIGKIRRVIVEQGAISGLRFLTNFTLDNIHQLDIRRDGMASHNQTSLRLVKMQNIRSLRVESGAFSGVWQIATSIQMHRIGEIHVESNALGYQVAEYGPSISLQHVGMLDLESKGFAAPLYRIGLLNVTMDGCHGGSFGGVTPYTEWNNVTIADARAKCFHSLNDFATFEVQSLRMQTVHHRAFSGSVRELTIDDSHFSTIQEKGFDIYVNSMEITKSSINELHSEGLTVVTRETFWLEKVRIEVLRNHAFIGLRMQESKELDPLLTIRKLEVIKSENGSLTFADCTKLRLTELDMVSPWPRICPTEKWTQSLSGGGVSGQLNPAQYQLFFQLFSRRMCLEDGWTKFPACVENPKCAARDEGEISKRDGSSKEQAADSDAFLDAMEHTVDDVEHTANDQANSDKTTESDLSNEAQQKPAKGGTSGEDSTGDALNSEEPEQMKGPRSAASTNKASGARAAGSEVAAGGAPTILPTAVPDTTTIYYKKKYWRNFGVQVPNKPFVNVAVGVKAVDVMGFPARKDNKVPASDESSEAAVSQKIKKYLSPAGEKGLLRRREVTRTVPTSNEVRSTADLGRYIDARHHWLLLQLVLGAMGLLTIMLTASLLLLLRRRGHSSGLDATTRACIERALMGESDVECGMVRESKRKASGPPRLPTKSTGEYAGFSSKCHHYEPMRDHPSYPRLGSAQSQYALPNGTTGEQSSWPPNLPGATAGGVLPVGFSSVKKMQSNVAASSWWIAGSAKSHTEPRPVSNGDIRAKSNRSSIISRLCQ